MLTVFTISATPKTKTKHMGFCMLLPSTTWIESMHITLSENLSYCVGVKRTLKLVNELLEKNPDHSYYMLGEIVHNEYVINELKSKGLHIIRNLDDITDHGTVIIQSHGVPLKVLEELKQKNINYIDATCPMVRVIHHKIKKLEDQGFFPVIIGKKGHDEVRGIAGQVKRSLIIGHPEEVKPDLFCGIQKAGVVVQSTYIRTEAHAIVDELKSLGLEIKFKDTICQPTTQRQDEMKNLAGNFDCTLIIGSKTSANTNHLYRLASQTETCVYLVDEPESVKDLPIPKDSTVFISSGASTPMYLIERVISILTQEQINNKR
ncbi:MAG: 4-hydroxy-3-methylbut-2-enyl diphosphate reductase [Candidatus Aminicenantes bacterium]|nr:4-hydroxy-3-methylbut-2-enyl diphosphate reductase [Candidatus Aminicenantes bacterium]